MAKRISIIFLLLLLIGQTFLGPETAFGQSLSTVKPTEEVLERTEMPWRDMGELAVRVKGVSPDTLVPSLSTVAPEQQVGDQTNFWVSDEANNRYVAVRAVLQAVTPRVYMYVENGLDLDQGKLREVARTFEEKIYSVNRSLFGPEARVGLDGDPRITILHAKIPGVAGYFTSVDSYPRSVQPYSNERKILYINVDAVTPGSDEYYSVLAHEFEHMIHWNTNKKEQTWIKEGAAEVASEAVSLPSISGKYFEAKPDTQLTGWTSSKGDVASHYGAAYLFLSYFLGRFGGYEEAVNLLTSETRGSETFDRFLASQGLTMEDVFNDWVIANYLDETDVRDPKYRYENQDVKVPATDRVTSSTGWRDRTVNQFAADYIEVNSRSSSATIRFQGEMGGSVISTLPNSGSAFWWSNRGDMVDTKLTRIFDLRGQSKATLKFWTWYDLEDDYDYAYVMASRDGGLTWSTLPAAGTTNSNPNGNNLGHGFTGKSGGGEAPQWVQQSVDLTPFVGDITLVRFELVTDDAFNAPGFAVDDLEIPELNYKTDAEADSGGWFADGFVRTDGQLTQQFSLQLIRFGEEITVEPVPLSPSGEATIRLEGADGRMEKAVLVVSALTRYTSEPARYRYTVEMAS
ncbi:MAG: hypothetical protein ACOX87_03850 [Chloroflexota bacterium]|jgi:immune inhibitor A